MTRLKLNNEFAMAVERYDKRARLIVYKNGAEDVCRKESFRNLERFILSDSGHAFKGRLQLQKTCEGVEVLVKGETLGSMAANVFLGYLARIKNNG